MSLYDKIIELGKRRAIFFPSFDIYGGISGFFNYGPTGALLKRNIEEKWRQRFVYQEGMVELESTIIMPEQAFLASGHIAHFTDFLITCTKCGKAFRADLLLNEVGVNRPEVVRPKDIDKLIEEQSITCPDCRGNLSQATPFNLMFQMKIGSYDLGQTGYGRPEAGQGQFVEFKRIYNAERERLPLGIAQVGRCVRNEIAPRKGPIRLREFTIIDYEVFFDPEDASYPRIDLLKDQKLRILTAKEQMAGSNSITELAVDEALTHQVVRNEILCYFMALAVQFLEELGIPPELQRLREQLPNERAHYSAQTFDQEVWLDRWGWTEISGHAYRTDYDLRNHMAHSGEDLRVYKAFKSPQIVIKTTVEPIKDQLLEDFGTTETERVITLLYKSDPPIVAKELEQKGFYEITGQFPIQLQPQHVKVAREKTEEAGRYFVPHVVEPSFGMDRIFYAVLEYAYTEKRRRIVLKVPKDIAAIKAAVFPLVTKDGLPELASHVYRSLVDEGFVARYDDSGSIGRRYARADEIGVSLCVTIDYQSLKDNTVTLRDLYTWKQVRAPIDDLSNRLQWYYKNKVGFEELGTPL